MNGAALDPPELERVLRGFSGKLAFDVGGNVGQTARLLAERFGRVVSFEPADESYAQLALVAKAHENIEAAQVAVTALEGPLVLTVQDEHIKTGQLTSSNADGLDWGRIVGTRVVHGVTIDSIAQTKGVPDFVKVDVEGHDAHVVLGGLRTLIDHTPQLYIEVHNADLGWRIRQMIGAAYGERLREVRHPHYPPESWGEANHYWLVAD